MTRKDMIILELVAKAIAKLNAEILNGKSGGADTSVSTQLRPTRDVIGRSNA